MNIGHLSKSFQQQWSKVQLSALAPLLSDDDIVASCMALGHRWRGSSPFPPPAVVRSMLYRSLHPDKSIVNVIEDLSADGIFGDNEDITDSAWCQARSRLPEGLYQQLVRFKALHAVERWGKGGRLFGRDIYRFDGTTVSMPDTPELLEAFGYSDGKQGPSRFPVARIGAFLQGAIPVITDYRIVPYKTSEVEMFREMLPFIPRDSIWVADRYLSNYVNFALSRQQGVEWISKLHHRRDGKALAQRGQRLAREDWLVTLYLSPATRRQYPELELPDEITIRLIRHRYRHQGKQQTVWLVTSLLDPLSCPREDIIRTYGERWEIETHYGYLKTALKMAVLRSKTPENIRSEIGAIILAHNLIWTLVYEAAGYSGSSPQRVSFAATVKTVVAYSPRLCAASGSRRLRLYEKMLRRIASHKNPYRPGRSEPRLVKRERKSFPALKTSREEARHAA